MGRVAARLKACPDEKLGFFTEALKAWGDFRAAEAYRYGQKGLRISWGPVSLCSAKSSRRTTPIPSPARVLGGITIRIQIRSVHSTAKTLIQLLLLPKCQGPRFCAHSVFRRHPRYTGMM